MTEPGNETVAARRNSVRQAVAEYGDPTPQSLEARGALAHRLLRTGSYAEALDECLLLRQGWDEMMPHAPASLLSRRLLVWALRELGRTVEAEDEQRRTVAEQSRISGPHSVPTLATRSNLVLLMTQNGKRAEALEECGDLLASCLRELGPEHDVTRSAVTQLAELQR